MINNRTRVFFIILLVIFSLASLLLVLPGCKKSEAKISVSTVSNTTENSASATDANAGSATESFTGTTETNESTAASTGETTASYLEETTDEVLFSFAVSGDNAPENDDLSQPEVFVKILNSMKEFNPSFYISTGDIINGSSLDPEIIKKQFSDFLEIVSVLNCPVYVAAGNHEVQNSASKNNFRKLLGNNEKTYYYFEYQDVFFIILDAYIDVRSGGGKITGDELLWLQNLLPSLKTEKVFVFLHPPVYSKMNPHCITDGLLHIAFQSKKNQDDIRKLFRDNNVDAVFSGHEHLFYMQRKGNTEYVITGSSGSEPIVSGEEGDFYHFLIIKVKENTWVLKVMDTNGELIEKNEIIFN